VDRLLLIVRREEITLGPLIEAGNVYLPHPDYAPWVDDFIEECAAFPNGAHDDQVDAMTQILLRWNAPREQTVVFCVEPSTAHPTTGR
jgi:phage terminase large subunit-like protein